MNKIPTYYAAPVRGELGDAVNDEDKLRNVIRARDEAAKFRVLFQELDIFCPHDHEDIIHVLWRAGKLATKDILWGCCQIIAPKRLVILRKPITEGMQIEWDFALRHSPKTFVVIDGYDGLAIKSISGAIQEVRNTQH